jgi:tRNA nucleotidyltransferase (CCA-adding enzyme)
MLPVDDLPERIRALPVAQPLLGALEGIDGVHLVGGAVRDLLLGGEPLDLDLVVEGDAGELAKAVAGRLGGKVVRYPPFLTARLHLDGHEHDFATARRERYPRPGAPPVVELATLEEDLPRRDFTIHALAASLAERDFGILRVAPRGLEDLEAGRLRVLHDRSFVDDPTRLLRLFRYAARLGFEIEPHTEELARAAIEQGALETASAARVRVELQRLLHDDGAAGALELAARLGLPRAALTSIAADGG